MESLTVCLTHSSTTEPSEPYQDTSDISTTYDTPRQVERLKTKIQRDRGMIPPSELSVRCQLQHWKLHWSDHSPNRLHFNSTAAIHRQNESAGNIFRQTREWKQLVWWRKQFSCWYFTQYCKNHILYLLLSMTGYPPPTIYKVISVSTIRFWTTHPCIWHFPENIDWLIDLTR